MIPTIQGKFDGEVDLYVVHQVVGLLHLKSCFDVRNLHQLRKQRAVTIINCV